MSSQKSKSSVDQGGEQYRRRLPVSRSQIEGFEVSHNGLIDDDSESSNADYSFSISRDGMIPIGTNGIGKCSWPNRVVVVRRPQDGLLCGFADPLYGFADPLCGFADPLYCFPDPCSGFTYLTSHFAQSRKGFRRQLSASRLPMCCQNHLSTCFTANGKQRMKI
jgi:hypothetical protein